MVKAPQVLQRCPVAQLVLVLQRRGEEGEEDEEDEGDEGDEGEEDSIKKSLMSVISPVI